MNNEIFNQKYHKISRSQLRNHMTKAELALWYRIRNNQLGCKFRRQHGIGKYIVDFYCPKAKLILEIDGGQHYEAANIKADRTRTEYLEKLGFKVLRFTNIDVLKNLENVLNKIWKEI